jgi:dihydrofolate synthase/folylpolyglutamate synthase
MNYAQATEYIQRLNRFGVKLGLERIEKLLSLLGNPHGSFRSVLVGGTSGKGSTTVMIGSVLGEAGYRTGVFTKPHLFDFRERIVVGGRMISERDFVRLVEKIKPFADGMEKDFECPTFFEFVTAMALEYFREKKVEFAILEVGLGGRLDATNAVKSEISVITHVALEHTDVLGETLEKIAKEKAGIIKEKGILVTSEDNPKVLSLFEKICSERRARLLLVSGLKNAKSYADCNSFELEGRRIRVHMGGRFQLKNMSCALAALKALDARIPAEAIKRGLEKVRWPGRFEMINERPQVLLDGAKDFDSMKNLMASLDLLRYEKLYTVFSASKDKMIPQMLKEANGKTDFFVLTKHGVLGRGAEPEDIAREVAKHGKRFIIVSDVKSAVRKAMELAGEKDLVLVTGSLFTVAEARELWLSKKTGMGREFNENFSLKK